MAYVHEEGTIFFEERYEQTLTVQGRNELWEEYYPKIEKALNALAYWKSFSKEDLIQISYIYFVELCERYDPYYEDGFFPFEKFMFKNLLLKLRAYIQQYYVKVKREPVSEDIVISVALNEYAYVRKTMDSYYSLDLEEALAALPERTRGILEMYMDGHLQEEIAKKYNISQSRVSTILRSVRVNILKILDNKNLLKTQYQFKNYKKLIDILEADIKFKLKQKPTRKKSQSNIDYNDFKRRNEKC